MPAPHEIVAVSLTMYIAPLGTTFPLPYATPSGDWSKLGTSGDLNMMDEGVTVEMPVTTNIFRVAGHAGPRKIFINEEDVVFRLVLADLTLEQFAKLMNGNTVTTTPPGGERGYKTMGLSRGPSLRPKAILLKGNGSAYGADADDLPWEIQYEVDRAVVTGSPALVHRRQEPVGVAVEWRAIINPDATAEQRLGRIRMVHAEAIS